MKNAPTHCVGARAHCSRCIFRCQAVVSLCVEAGLLGTMAFFRSSPPRKEAHSPTLGGCEDQAVHNLTTDCF